MKRWCSILLILLITAALFAEESVFTLEDLSVSRELDWESAELRIHITARLPGGGMNAPTLPHRVESRIEERLPVLLRDALLPFKVNSLQTIRDIVLRNDRSIQELTALSEHLEKKSLRLSRDLKEIRLTYTLPFFPHLAELFLDFRKPAEVPHSLGWVPSGQFTGIIIYAQGSYPVHGTGTSAQIEACLLPDIFDENMREIFEGEMIKPAAFTNWGIAGYSAETDYREHQLRVGVKPLTIMATGIFGKNRTDLIISERDAEKIISREENRELLARGRILIIIDEEKLLLEY